MKKVLALLITAVLMLSGCSGGTSTGNGTAPTDAASSGESKLSEIKKAKKLTIYTNAEFPPYEFLDNNEIVGVDIEIGKEIAKKLDVELEVVNAEFSGIVASIASGKGDLGLSGITITEGRKESVDFSHPYVDSVQYLILPEDSPLKVMEDLKDLTLGAQTGTTGAMLVEEEISDGVLQNTKTELKTYNSAPSAMQDLASNRIVAVVIDELVAIAIAKENPGFKAIPFVYQDGAPVTEQFGVAVKKGNEDLLKIVNEVIDDLTSKGKIREYIDMFSDF